MKVFDSIINLIITGAIWRGLKKMKYSKPREDLTVVGEE